MVDLTTEQEVPFTFQAKDGRGRTVAVDGTPVAASSDETVATVTLEAGSGNVWNGLISSVMPGSARITVSADVDISPEVQEVIGSVDVNVTLDPLTAARTVELTVGTPVDKAV